MDAMRDVVTTRNGKHVLIDTRYVPFPIGNGFETGVYQCNAKGTVVNYKKELDGNRYKNDDLAEVGHREMINKWSENVLV